MIPLMHADEPISPDLIMFINRVSDLLFAMPHTGDIACQVVLKLLCQLLPS